MGGFMHRSQMNPHRARSEEIRQNIEMVPDYDNFEVLTLPCPQTMRNGSQCLPNWRKGYSVFTGWNAFVMFLIPGSTLCVILTKTIRALRKEICCGEETHLKLNLIYRRLIDKSM
jgi:hypothetical protein